MKKMAITLSMAAGLVAGVAGNAMATPLDLSGFSVMESIPSSVEKSGGVINFIENPADAALYFYNDSFVVPSNATALSFDYQFALGPEDTGDYLEFNVNFTNQLTLGANGGGHFVYDLSGLRTQTIALDWGLIWGGDDFSGATARIYHIDLASSSAAPVPEPATIFLMGSGLAGLYGARRRKKHSS